MSGHKTHSGAKKRFRLTGRGKVRARHFEPTILKRPDAKRARGMIR